MLSVQCRGKRSASRTFDDNFTKLWHDHNKGPSGKYPAAYIGRHGEKERQN